MNTVLINNIRGDYLVRKLSIVFVSLFLSFNLLISNVQAQTKTLVQGIYNANTSNLLIGTPLKARINSTNDRAIVIIIDSNQNFQELVRLNAQSQEHTMKPLEYGSSLVIIGANVSFS